MMHTGGAGDGAKGRDRVLLGATLVAAAGLMFALAGMAIKMAGAHLSSVEVLFWRNVLSLAILVPWILWYWPRSLRPEHGGLMALRGVAVVASLLCYYYAVKALPLAEAVLLNFSSPIFVPLLGFLLFRFALDRKVLLAVAVGFVGVALILKPGTDFFRPDALIGVASGALGGLAAVAVWRMPADESPVRIAVYFALIGIAITVGPAIVVNPALLPPAEAWPALIMLGLFSTAAHILFARGCLVAPADRVSPLDYTSVFFAAALAWLIWGEGVDWFTAAGTALVVAGGVIAIRKGRGEGKA
ncbi:MAG: DMT family transporter [Alphaproteobacteria bacterium]|nr:DMT family transporter [Alphaproteobacteria bacterium]